ncbi:hypothetical protein [[Clostridium] fimetarium]|uniref:hypothetical protein n=1 Tax=[Clostridium] fimetarium TaxID=99656 RepID=UPI00147A8A5B|nr:hypothetical protein [[Clostridium] fimetarium]
MTELMSLEVISISFPTVFNASLSLSTALSKKSKVNIPHATAKLIDHMIGLTPTK